jgi:hypothetical protein
MNEPKGGHKGKISRKVTSGQITEENVTPLMLLYGKVLLCHVLFEMHVPLPVNRCSLLLKHFYVHFFLFLIFFWFVSNKLLDSNCNEYYKLQAIITILE